MNSLHLQAGRGGWWLLLAAWLLVLLTSLLTRPLLPVDETRYAAVAWEMWARGDFLVPWLNAAPYSHKPPLFFWLVHAGWWLFGVNEWVVRLVSPLLLLLTCIATAALGRQLWPSQRAVAQQVPLVLFSCVLLTAFYSWVQIDLLLVLCVLVALNGVVLAAQGQPAGWLLAGVGIGLGVLAKGPVVLLHVLPVALMAPAWKRSGFAGGWLRWYGGLLFAVLLGAALALAWAVPAASSGGEAYREAIFWGQTADRVLQSFAHAHPFWWYLPWLGVLLAPWCFLPWLWGRIGRARFRGDEGLGFCLSWLVTVFLLMSLISGKQAKYLLPLLPAFALLVTRVLAITDDQPVQQRSGLLAALLVLLGVLGITLPLTLQKAAWINAVHPAWGGLLVLLGIAVYLYRPVRPLQYPAWLLLVSSLAVGIAQAGVFRVAAPSYDLAAASRFVADAIAGGHRVATLKRYHGQFGFHGRIVEPIDSLVGNEVVDWMAAHPHGFLVAISGDAGEPVPGAAYSQPYRGGTLSIVAVDAVDSVESLPD